MVTGTAFGAHDRAFLERAGLRVRDVTSSESCFALWGPGPSTCCPTSTARSSIGVRQSWVTSPSARRACPSRASRAGSSTPPPSSACACGRRLWELGAPHGLVAGGYRAIDSLRLEKGYRVWGADITPDVTPAEAGLGRGDHDRAVRCLLLDDPRAVALGNEPVRVGGDIVGRVTSGGYGYTVERSIAYAMLPAAVEGEVEVDVFGEWIPATVSASPPL